jgi:hypothetical protein
LYLFGDVGRTFLHDPGQEQLLPDRHGSNLGILFAWSLHGRTEHSVPGSQILKFSGQWLSKAMTLSLFILHTFKLTLMDKVFFLLKDTSALQSKTGKQN